MNLIRFPIFHSLKGFPPCSLVSPKRVVGCKGGSRYFDGGFQDIDFPRCTKIPTTDLPNCTENPQSTINDSNKYRSFFKIILDLIGFTCALGSVTIIQDLLRFHHPAFHFYLKRSRNSVRNRFSHF